MKRERVVHDVPDAEKTCPCCSSPRVKIGEETSEQLDYLVGMLAPKRQELAPEEFDELPNDGSSSAEDGTTECTSPSAKTMFPASFIAS